MLEWLAYYWPTILVCLALGGIVFAIIFSMVRSRKKGKTSCGCDCGHCALHGSCHWTVCGAGVPAPQRPENSAEGTGMQQALSASNIKYLLALRSLCGPSNEIRCVSVADALGISKASVHAMMNALKEKNLIEKNHYGMVHFTPEGRSLADQYAACYDVLAGYLHRVSSEEAALRAALCAFLAELPPDHLGRLCQSSACAAHC